MEKIWLSEYLPGVPAEIDNNDFNSLRDLMDHAFENYAEQPAYTNMDVTLSYAEMDRLSARLAAYFQRQLGLEKGDRVAIMMPNILLYPVAMFAALRAGLVVVNVNPLYTPRELEHQLSDSGARAIVIMENFAATLGEVIDNTAVETVITTELGDLFPGIKRLLTNFVVKRVKKMVPAFSLPNRVKIHDAFSAGDKHSFEPPPLTLEDLAFLQYTGGTTGVSKGAMLSHSNLVHNIQQSTSWIGNKTDDNPIVAITALPLYHIFSLEGNCLGLMQLGGHNVLITNPRDFTGFVKELSKHPFSYFTGVNTLFNALLHTPGFEELDFSSLTISIGGGMAVQESVANHWHRVTGCPIIQAYGLTETSPAAVINPFVDDPEFSGSIGLPISSTDVAIFDDDGNELAIGDIGEICIRGPQVMEGYWQRPEETEKVMLPGGWLKTGDMGRIDERGYVFIEDRKKDMILVSGFNVYPNEIESVVASLDGVLEAAAVAKADDRAGEVVQLFVVRSDPNLTAEAIIEHCKAQLTGYKVPKYIVFRDELPKTNVGKILRRALRDDESA